MDCQEVHKFVHPYLDGEFGEDDRVAFAAHLSGCEHCRRVVRFEEQFKEKLSTSANPLPTAPGRLRARVGSLLAEETAREERRNRRRWTLRLVPALAAAAALAIALGVTLQGGQAPPAEQQLAEQSVRWHRTALPLDVTDSRGGKIRKFFRDKVPFAVRLPRLRNKNARLVGARLTQLRGQQAVYLTYQLGGQRVSFFVVDPRTLPSRRPQWRGVQGYNVGTYVSGGTGYAVTSEMDRGRLVRLISASSD
jgi:anti-sigma factor (TIGR02949 family)